MVACKWYSFRLSIYSVLITFLIGQQCQAQTTWRRTYGGYGSNVGNSVRETTDGGFIIAGSTGSFGGDGDAYVVKTDASGLPQWTHVYGGSGIQTGVACQELSDGYVLAGTTSVGDHGGYDMFLVRTDQSGNVIWQRTYGTPAWDICNDMQVTSNGFVLVGTSYENNAGDAFVVRTDFNGDTLWTKMIGGQQFDQAQGVCVTTDDGVVVTGATSMASGDMNAFVTKLNPAGGNDWFTTFGGDSLDYFYSAVETPDGGFVCSGGTNSYSNVKQVLLAKVDMGGESLWQQEFGSMGDSEGREIQLNLNGDYAIASYNSFNNAGGKDMVLLIVSTSGYVLLGKNYGGLGDEEGNSLQVLPDGGYVIAGTTQEYGPGIQSIYVVRADSAGETDDDTVYEMFDDTGVNNSPTINEQEVSIYPNPASSECHFSMNLQVSSIQIIDVLGRVVRTWTSPVPDNLQLDGLDAGRYQLMATMTKGSRFSFPLVILSH